MFEFSIQVIIKVSCYPEWNVCVMVLGAMTSSFLGWQAVEILHVHISNVYYLPFEKRQECQPYIENERDIISVFAVHCLSAMIFNNYSCLDLLTVSMIFILFVNIHSLYSPLFILHV